MVLLLAAGALALLQQQLLWHRPPRLLELRQASASSGPAALSLRFSRPMRALSVAGSSRLLPALPFTIQGRGTHCCCCRTWGPASISLWSFG